MEGTVEAVVGTEVVMEVDTTAVAAEDAVVGQHTAAADGDGVAVEMKDRIVYCQLLTSKMAVEGPTSWPKTLATQIHTTYLRISTVTSSMSVFRGRIKAFLFRRSSRDFYCHFCT